MTAENQSLMSLIQSRVFVCCVACFLLPLQVEVVHAQPSRGPATVAVGQVIPVRQAGQQTFVGTIVPTRKSIIGTAVDGRVVTMDLNPGDPVFADRSLSIESAFVGQPVAQLRTGTLEIEIGSAEIQMKLAQQAVEELAVSLPKEIESMKAKAAEAQARLRYSKTNYGRLDRMGDGAISQGELEEARGQFQADQEAANAARIDSEKMASVKETRLTQASLRVRASEQEVKRLYDLKAKYTIRTPYEGLVTKKLTDVGEWVTKGQPIVEVVQLNPIEMIVNVPQKHISNLQLSIGAAGFGKPLLADIEIDGYDQTMKGIVKRVVAQGDLRSRTFPVRIEIENKPGPSGHRLQPGMLGRAKLTIGAEQDMLMVKKDALVLSGAKTSVFKIVVADDESTVVLVPVRTGASLNDWIQVTGDLSQDDQVVVLGNERLRPGQAVKVTQVSDDRPD